MKPLKFLVTCILSIAIFGGVNAQKKEKHPKNIILMIGDGMGVAQIFSAYTLNKGEMNIEQFKVIGFSKTSSYSDYITDSAAGATAFSIGKKTYNGAIGVDKDTVPFETILEEAEGKGLSTGLVVTCAITHATPAAFIAHQASREFYEDIAADFLKTDIDVFIGGGGLNFSNRHDSVDLVAKLKQKNYQVARTMNELAAVEEGKLAGLVFEEHGPRMLDGRGDYLSIASKKALDILDDNHKGFFLMVEGSQIDWGNHQNDANYMSSEMLDFDNTIGKVLEWAKADGQTLVIVTADHECGGFTITGGNLKQGTFTGAFSTKHHTPVMVPVFAYGPGAEQFMGIYENTEIYKKMVKAFKF
jgi:alkaline phosphatase